ncbi:hypothetical protein SELMODRAFT_78732 [Selaginella moellendorffii]|uniref:Glutathione peroxidase n=1 Tax=Selaginella moellendorffii TaxID=88036 RepID=D8QW53_SELML|nr:hypothetical protein SELMODRAFT_112558 [Selaginella moellendorffii]EFJ36574.1 hypothetical protein SELMODRAFT_78732 [Selaginella moellendorffii]
MSKYKNKVLLIVNLLFLIDCIISHMIHVLQACPRSSTSSMLEILAFPCNQFAVQEPLSLEYLQEIVSS